MNARWMDDLGVVWTVQILSLYNAREKFTIKYRRKMEMIIVNNKKCEN